MSLLRWVSGAGDWLAGCLLGHVSDGSHVDGMDLGESVTGTCYIQYVVLGSDDG